MIERDELDRLAETFGTVERLTWQQVADFSARAWTTVADLTPAERAELRAGLLDGSLPPGLVADAEDRYTRVQGAALALWTTYKPQKSADLAAWAALVIALLTYLDREPAPQPGPPSPQVIIIELPPENRPTGPSVEPAPDGSTTPPTP